MVETLQTEVVKKEEKEEPKKNAGGVLWLFGGLGVSLLVFTLLILLKNRVITGGMLLLGFVITFVFVGVVAGAIFISNHIRNSKDVVLQEKQKPMSQIEAQQFIKKILSDSPLNGGFLIPDEEIGDFGDVSVIYIKGLFYFGRNYNVPIFRIAFRCRNSNMTIDTSVRLDNKNYIFLRFDNHSEWEKASEQIMMQIQNLAGYSYRYAIRRETMRDLSGGTREVEEQTPFFHEEEKKEEKGELE